MTRRVRERCAKNTIQTGSGLDRHPWVVQSLGRSTLFGATDLYDCKKCPGYCCSYPVIALDRRDVERLARHLGISYEDCERRHTRSAYGRKWIFRRKADKHFGRICKFFDTEKRRCTVYEGRPSVCRSFPGAGRCGYYDFLAFERRAQNDADFIALTNHK